jgi:hypothetical protein
MGLTLYTNGCSWTWGGGIEVLQSNDITSANVITEARSKVVWPHHLGKLLNASNVINFSMSCGSNERMFRMTFDWLLQQDEETLKNTIAVIQLTDNARYEYYSTDKQEGVYLRDNTDWRLVKIGHTIGRGLNGVPPEEHKVAQERYKLWSNTQDMYTSLNYIAALQNLFHSYNVKYYFWTFTGNWLAYPLEIKSYLDRFYPTFIDKPWWYRHNDFWKYEQVNSTDLHPSLTGHIQIAQTIYNCISNNR